MRGLPGVFIGEPVGLAIGWIAGAFLTHLEAGRQNEVEVRTMDNFWVIIGSAIAFALTAVLLYALYRFFRDNLRLK